MSDKSIKLYDYLDEKEKVARVLFENGIIVTNLSSAGDTLEDYFISIVGGGRNV
jgi:ABC-2 type transport system ATP-binding protein